MNRDPEDPDNIDEPMFVVDAEQPIVVIEAVGASEEIIDLLIDAWLTEVEQMVTVRLTSELNLSVDRMDPGEFIASHRVRGSARAALRHTTSQTEQSRSDFAFARFVFAKPRIVS